MTYDVLISYSRKDSDVASKIYDSLTSEGITCFIDRQGISGGADFPTVLAEAIMGAKVLLLVASKNSYASEFTQKELTFAVSNKGSRFIFPLIVDDSELPQNLEFLLSNINWRTLSSHYRIDKDLVTDIKKKLADPHAGETLKQRERKSLKSLITVVVLVMVMTLSGIILLELRNRKEKELAEQVKKTAIKDSRECEQLFSEASTQISRADELREQDKGIGNSLSSEVSCLTNAISTLDRIDSLRRIYKEQPLYSPMFQSFSTEPLRRKAKHRQDSMFNVWNNRAIDAYAEYVQFSDSINRQLAIKYVNYALSIVPTDKALKTMKESFN